MGTTTTLAILFSSLQSNEALFFMAIVGCMCLFFAIVFPFFLFGWALGKMGSRAPSHAPQPLPQAQPGGDDKTRPIIRREVKATLTVTNREESTRLNIYGDTTKIGRVQKFADLVIDDPTVSRLHCQIKKKTHGDFYLYHEGATNGTFINEKELIEPGDGQLLKSGDLIRLGEVELRFQRKGHNWDNPRPKDDEDGTKPYRPHRSDN